mmetsp:Transcript_1641/g.2660  ORF Transcript_1641/g.2660 Transcript_1641/m.2660 type:complete len:210 (-) Transcript_1641:124-753(-)
MALSTSAVDHHSLVNGLARLLALSRGASRCKPRGTFTTPDPIAPSAREGALLIRMLAAPQPLCTARPAADAVERAAGCSDAEGLTLCTAMRRAASRHAHQGESFDGRFGLVSVPILQRAPSTARVSISVSLCAPSSSLPPFPCLLLSSISVSLVAASISDSLCAHSSGCVSISVSLRAPSSFRVSVSISLPLACTTAHGTSTSSQRTEI